MITGTAYGAVIGRNVSAARGRLQMRQTALADRMRTLGFPWMQQTVAVVEKGKRRATAEEILGLALALETSIPALMSPHHSDGDVTMPAGCVLRGDDVRQMAGQGHNDRTFDWERTRQRLAS